MLQCKDVTDKRGKWEAGEKQRKGFPHFSLIELSQDTD